MANISARPTPASASIRRSSSTKATPSFPARSLPTVVLPAPRRPNNEISFGLCEGAVSWSSKRAGDSWSARAMAAKLTTDKFARPASRSERKRKESPLCSAKERSVILRRRRSSRTAFPKVAKSSRPAPAVAPCLARALSFLPRMVCSLLPIALAENCNMLLESHRGVWLPLHVDMASPSREEAIASFEVSPEKYIHWKLSFDGPIARLSMDVQEGRGLRPDYDLKLNSYDLGVDLELADAVQRIRFEHPEVRVVVLSSLKDRIFCAGANIFMLGTSSHPFKVNFCKFTNETRLA